MTSCCICQLRVRNVQNIFQMRLGNSPPVLIGDVIRRLVKGTSHKFDADSKICRKCCDKVLRWHNSVKVAQQVQRELLQMLDDAKTILLYETLKEEEEEEDEQSEEYAEWLESKEEEGEEFLEFDEPSKTEIVRFECEFDSNEDKMEIGHQEDINTEVETTLIQFVVKEDDDIENSESDENFGEISDNDHDYVEVQTRKSLTKTTSKSLNDGENEDEGEDNDDIEIDEDYIKPRQKKRKGPPQKTKKVIAHRLMATADLKCSECDTTFMNKRQFNAHIKKDHFSGFICDQCGKTLHSYSGFVNHRENHNPVKTLECPECGERFHLKSRLRHHMAWHSGEKPYQCDICSKRFVHRVALQRHIRIHDESSRRLECEVCGFKFRTKPHLDRHMATHTGAKPHSCPICGKCFAQLYNMRVHVQEHEQPGSTRQRRLKCKKCSHTFINKENYQDHCKRGDCKAAE